LSRNISKAFLLAAGLGTRLRPLTDRIPKCLVPIAGKPLLSWWLDVCERLGIREVLINTHHLAEQVDAWAREQKTNVVIHLRHETELLGSAGTVAAHRAFFDEVESFYVFYADNLVQADLTRLKALHLEHEDVLTMGLFRTPNPRACGIATLDDSGRITSFEEKPLRPRSDLANAGIYIVRRGISEFLPSRGFADFGKDIFPRLVGRMWGRDLGGYLLDIGTPENYRKALQDWPAVSEDGLSSSRVQLSTHMRDRSE
jgi:mannose-1-phosphate guanylyltransferase